MKLFRRKKQIPKVDKESLNKKALDQKTAADLELTIARGIAIDMRRIRSENHFIIDFREVLGGGRN